MRIENITAVYFCWHLDGEDEQQELMAIHSETDECSTYDVTWMAPAHPGLVWYYFAIHNQDGSMYYGNNQDGYGGVGIEITGKPPKYQITVYQDVYLPPAWFQGKVIYQILVDRFYNGHTDNQILHAKKNSVIHSHWENDPLYIRGENGDILRWDFYGGNLLGVIKKLAYLSELGVDIIYLNPVFQAPSNHKYDTGDYHKIDEMFGNEEIFQKLCDEAKKYGISIILDGVFSHTGSDSKYFNKQGSYDSIGAYQSKDSPYFSWYRFHQHPEDYESWWGIDVMPNVNELDSSYQSFIIDAKDSVINYWQRFGIIGWRLDVADELPDQFIKRMKRQLRTNNPDSVLIGEVWEDASNKISYSERREYLLGDELDSVTNYLLRDMIIRFILGHIDAGEVHLKMNSMLENYPTEHFNSLMNIVGTHDTPRILSLVNQDVDDDTALKRVQLISIWQLLLPGNPCIYYGDEAGLTGIEEPLNRRTYPWGNENSQLLNWYRNILKIKKKYNVFQTGDFESFHILEDLYGFKRSTQSVQTLVLINRSDQEKNIKLEDWHTEDTVMLVGNKDAFHDGITIPAFEAVVLIKQ
ncbi:glycoside hydrolase family 13 protein [Radiobacillus sp. PE A8.2]|uniref:glycoside hydrolase family 13 protein n=1 Tax=Radiobacillus sp. PE A8.2 TaxID=3380349 RepID=UPI003890A9FE